MVVENRVLMKVVFPNPDSPATLETSVDLFDGATHGKIYHNGKGGATLCNDLMSVLESVDGLTLRLTLEERCTFDLEAVQGNLYQ